jgi:hypothetical protein
LGSPELVNAGTNNIPAAATVCVSAASNATVGDPITVKVTADYHWLQVPALGGAFQFVHTPISGQATMRLEVPPPSGFVTQNTACS